jgi:hypothetical protein
MDSRNGVKIFSPVSKRVVRQASSLVDAYEGPSYAYFFHCINVIFFRPMGHYIRNNYSVLLNMAPIYHIVVVCVI